MTPDVPPTAAESVRVVVAGGAVQIEHAWIGSGNEHAPLVVFLHEGSGSVSMWKDYPAQLCAALRMRGLVYSRPGYGRSTPRKPDERWTVDYLHRQAHDVLPALLAELGVKGRPWLLGHSDGGSIALLFAAAFTERVTGVIALAPHLFVEDVSVRSIKGVRDRYETGDLRARLARHHANPDSAFFGWNDIWLDPAFRGWSIEDDVAAIRCPVLAVQGEDDEYGTMAQIDRLAGRVPQAELVKLAGCGHSPHRDQPALLTEAVGRFVGRG